MTDTFHTSDGGTITYTPAVVPPPVAGPILPAALAARAGQHYPVSIDPASMTWDIGAGGSPVFGTTNGGIKSAASMASLQADGLHVATTDTQGVWFTSMPRGMAGNGRGGGAAVGFVLPRQFILQGVMSVAKYGWGGLFTQTRQTDGTANGGAGYGEHDLCECAGWKGGSGAPTCGYHFPGGIVPNGLPIGLADGKVHAYTMLRDANMFYYCVDGALVTGAPWPIHDQGDHVIHLINGYQAGQPKPAAWNLADTVVKTIDAWALAA